MKRYVLLGQVSGILLLSVVVACFVVNRLYFFALLSCCGVGVLTASLYLRQQRIVRRMESMITYIRYGDLNLTFPSSAKGLEGKLFSSMNEALSAFRKRLYRSVVAEAETEAWQKLIRVLTHEMMNSIAPIISLSETVSERAEAKRMDEKEYAVMLQAIQTIHRRSKGLLDFIENYRKLTRIPMPVLSPFPVSLLFEDLKGLFPASSARFTYTVIPARLRLYADRSLVEQVMINLLKNAEEACRETEHPEIAVKAMQREGEIVITVQDNGSGILPEALDKIYVPFFTTKPGGSGIGLSVCCQIMYRHGGSLSVVSSSEGSGTLFALSFPTGISR